MQVLLYNELDPTTISGFDKWRALMEADDLKSADVKKIGDNLYRARLNRSDRLLLAFYRFQTKRYALVLEYLPNHGYERSRFLNHTNNVDETKVPTLISLPTDIPNLSYVPSEQNAVHILDKVVCFDEAQEHIYHLSLPLILIGAAGSGKTMLTLEKLKQKQGNVLYVTLSSYLAANARNLYHAKGYTNPKQHVDFFSYDELLASIAVPSQHPLDIKEFCRWHARLHRPQIKDAYKLFEEFRGVLIGVDTQVAYLKREDYLQLGVRQSIFLPEERTAVYDIFERYLVFLTTSEFYDVGLLSHQYLDKVRAQYDLVVVDEIQDFTNIQILLIFKHLIRHEQFVLCGDANQIVHPNFFSWSKLKQFFFAQFQWQAHTEIVQVLTSNYRNAGQITALANRLLLLKTARFGSLDKVSHYLLKNSSAVTGQVLLLENLPQIQHEINTHTRLSTQVAVIVLDDSQKEEAQRIFQTPLVFSIQEAKGLEYETVVLYNAVQCHAKRFLEIIQGIEPDYWQQDLRYARAHDKHDKSLEVYKFYVNTLYVALTRAIKYLYWLEADTNHPLLTLLGLTAFKDSLTLTSHQSSFEAWTLEAKRLEQQGKHEQAQRIHAEILQYQPATWVCYDTVQLAQLYDNALQQQDKKSRLMLFEYALVYHDQQILNALQLMQFKPALHPERGIVPLQQKHYLPFMAQSPLALRDYIQRYGLDVRNVFNQTPLMAAVWLGNTAAVVQLLAEGASLIASDTLGFTVCQIALSQASHSVKYRRLQFAEIYPLVAPATLMIQLDGRVLQLSRNTLEYVLVQLMWSWFYQVLPIQLVQDGAFSAAFLAEKLADLPIGFMQLSNLNAQDLARVLEQHDMFNDTDASLKLFYQVRDGHYVLNPTMMWLNEGKWVNVYEVLKLERLAIPLTTDAAVNATLQQQLVEAQQRLQQRFQQVRTNLLNEALSVLQLLCAQELLKINPDTSQKTGVLNN